jgi:hypothetical protein
MLQIQWNLNGAPIPGETNQCLIVTQSGTYSLTGTTQYGCSSTSDSLMLMVINCDCESLSASVNPTGDSCCWTLNFTNNFGGLFGVQIHTTDADFVFDLGSLDNALSVFSVTSNSIGLVNSQTGSPLPSGTLAGFLDFCLENVVNSPQQIIFDWYDFDFNVVCSDTITLHCPVEPDCLYLQSDSIWCKGKDVFYSMTVCNPVDADFAVAYILVQPTSPTGILVTPNTIDETANPIQPGECRTYTLALTGTGIAGQMFCFGMTAHDAVPDEIDSTLCCMLDTAYCIEIPDCNPCDDIAVEGVEALSAKDGKCCYAISLFNNFAPGYFDGVGLCMLSAGTTMTINNPFGSGWFTASYSPTVIDLNVGPPLGASLPLGLIQLPQICVQTSVAPSQFLEIKWMAGDSVVCRDTVELGCEPPCGYVRDEVIGCDSSSGSWAWAGAIVNTSAYTIGEAHFIFTTPAGMFPNNTTVSLGSLVPGGTQAFNLTLGPPALPGDTVCFTVSLHATNDDAAHTQCCNFNDCVVLPDCDPLTPGTGEKFLLFPNPSSGQVFARYSPKWTAGVRIRVYDMLGRGVSDQEFPDAAGLELLPLQFGLLDKGLYTVVVESAGKRWVEKLVIN